MNKKQSANRKGLARELSKRGLSVRQIAARLYVSPNAVQRYLKG